MAVISKDLGPITAYAAAVNRGYTGTREEFETLMASYATVAEQAGESAESAEESAASAAQSAASASQSAQNAEGSRYDALLYTNQANGYKNTANTAAQAAKDARDAAQSAQTAAEAAQAGAEAAVDGFDGTVTAAISDVNAAGTNQKELAKRQAEKSEAWAVGKINGEDVGVSDPAYHNNAKYYAESAGTSATTATTKAGEAAQSAANASASASAAAASAQSLVIDETLSVEGRAADAKATGDKITGLKEDLNEQKAKVVELDCYTGITQNVSGSTTSTKYPRIYIYGPFKNGQRITIHANSYSVTPSFVHVFGVVNGSGTNIKSNITTPNDFYVDFSNAYDSIYITTTLSEAAIFSYNVNYLISNSTESINNRITTIESEIVTKADETDVQKIEANVDTLDDFVGVKVWKNLVNPAELDDYSYIEAPTGKKKPSDYNKATGFIYLEKGQTYYVNNIYMNGLYAFYSAPSESSFVASPVGVTVTHDDGNNWHGTIVTTTNGYYFRGTNGRSEDYANPYISNLDDSYHQYGMQNLRDLISEQGASPRSKVLIIGDSICTDTYGNYTKWVTVLKNEGFLPNATTNSSIHATGYVAKPNIAGEHPNYRERIIAITDKSSYDMVILFGSINDFSRSIPIETNPSDSNPNPEQRYYKAAVDYVFEYVSKNFTRARICVILPLRMWKTINDLNKTVYDYNQCLIDAAKEYAFPVLNLTDESGFCPEKWWFKDAWTLIPAGYENADGVHPNEEYQRDFLAPMIKRFLINM